MNKSVIYRLSIFLLFLLSFCDLAFSQEYNYLDLEGAWKANKKTALDGDDGSSYTLTREPWTVNLELKFSGNKKVRYKNAIEDLLTTYTLDKDTIRIFHFVYTIKNLTENELVLKEENFLGGLIYFKRKN